MKELIKRILKEEQETPVLTKKEILLFKYINDNKQKAGTKSEMIKFIQEMLRYIGMPLNESTMYYEIYTANFRPDGDYENLTKENFKDYRLFKQRKVANNSAYEYATAKMPFKGSNVEGQWNVNNNNDFKYIIEFGLKIIYDFIFLLKFFNPINLLTVDKSLTGPLCFNNPSSVSIVKFSPLNFRYLCSKNITILKV